MIILANDRRSTGLPDLGIEMRPVTNVANVSALLARCPAARRCTSRTSGRMGLGSFKALGAAYAIAVDTRAKVRQTAGPDGWTIALADVVYVAASAGNHGISVAAGARVFGATAVIFLSESVPEAFADRLRANGARIERVGATYEETMQAAAEAAERLGPTLGQSVAQLSRPTAPRHGRLSADGGRGR